MKSTQRQRRFLFPNGLPTELECELANVTHINDGYIERPGGSIVRVRVIKERFIGGGQRAYMTRKIGRGGQRQVEHVELSTAKDGLRMLHWCHYRLKKRRYVIHTPQQWTVDVFEGPLEGLVLAESKGAVKKLPPWTHDAVDVTDSLTNFHFARLAHDLTQRTGDSPVDEAMRLAQRLPRIVLTGGPCSGKSTVMETLKAKFTGQLHCVPEVATIVIGQIGVKPWTGGSRNLFAAQRLMYRAQRAFEDASDSQARTDGKSAMLLDRGIGDIGAYLPGGITDIEPLCLTTVAHEFARYDLVIVLDLPSETVYEANRTNNPARTETYDKAQALANGIRRAWSTHPNYRFVADTALWHEKEATVVSLVETFLRTPRP